MPKFPKTVMSWLKGLDAAMPSLRRRSVSQPAVWFPRPDRRTISKGSELPFAQLSPNKAMRAGQIFDAALANLEGVEAVTIPALKDVSDWESYEAACWLVAANLSRATRAAHFRRARAVA